MTEGDKVITIMLIIMFIFMGVFHYMEMIMIHELQIKMETKK